MLTQPHRLDPESTKYAKISPFIKLYTNCFRHGFGDEITCLKIFALYVGYFQTDKIFLVYCLNYGIHAKTLNNDLSLSLTVHQVAETRSIIDCPINDPDAILQIMFSGCHILGSTGRSWDDLVSAT